MKDPERLAHQPRGAIEVELVCHARAECPPPEELARLAAVLGVATASAEPGAATLAAARAPMENGLASVASPSRASLSGTLARRLLFGGTVALIGAGSFLGLGLRANEPVAASVAGSSVANSTSVEPSGSVASSPELQRLPARDDEETSSPGSGLASLAPELLLLDRARKLLDMARPAQALATLDAYDAQFPAGTLAPEARVIRVQALVRAGKRAQAQKVGAEFLVSAPSSPHAHRIRELLRPDESRSGERTQDP